MKNVSLSMLPISNSPAGMIVNPILPSITDEVSSNPSLITQMVGGDLIDDLIELSQEQETILEGGTILTDGYDSDWELILHVVPPIFDPSSGVGVESSYEILSGLYEDCLFTGMHYDCMSIAIPLFTISNAEIKPELLVYIPYTAAMIYADIYNSITFHTTNFEILTAWVRNFGNNWIE